MISIKILLLIFSGAVLLYYGGDYLVKGGTHLAKLLGVSSLVIGLTIVAFGTSLPELVVSLVAALQGSESIATGNVIGSNIANVGLIIGLSATIFRIIIGKYSFIRDLNFLVIISLIFTWMAWDGIIDRWEGVILVLGLIIYTTVRISTSMGNSKGDNKSGSYVESIVFVVLGIIGLSVGAKLFVIGATMLAEKLGVPEFVIGITIAAYGTSLPELATSLVAAYRKESEISIGNIIGSNIFNIMAVLGTVSIIRPLPVERSAYEFEIPIMLLYVLALFPLLRSKGYISKYYALILLIGYVVFVTILFVT